MTDIPQRELDSLYDRIEADLKTDKRSKEFIQKALSDPDFVAEWLTEQEGHRKSRGIKSLAKLVTSSHKVQEYIRKGKVVRGHRQSRRGWTDEEKQYLMGLSVDMNLHELTSDRHSVLYGRSYDSIRRKRQSLRKKR